MRRDEFLTTDPAFLGELSDECPEGYLALDSSSAPGSFPRAIPVNFALDGDRIYFHGALSGDKFERIGEGTAVGFSIVRPYSLLPSTWMSRGDSACPATQLFLSIEVSGRCESIEDPVEKAQGLQAIMLKYQPEGGYRRLTTEDSAYTASIRGTGVFRIAIESWTGKVRMAQEKSPEFRQKLLSKLRERGLPIDLATADRIARGLEFEKSDE